MAVSLLVILTVQAVPTLLSCLAFTSFSPLFFVGSLPFSLLFATLSVLISVASWCWSPHEVVLSAGESGEKYSSSLYTDCSRVSSNLANRSWWCCGEAPRGFQLAMLFLTWALLFLLLCMPPMANAEVGKVQADTERLPPLGDRPDILEVTWKDSNEVGTASHGVDSGGPEKRHEDATSGPKLNNAVEERISQQSSFDSVDSDQSEARSSAPDGKVELQSCRALVRAGQQVTCAAPEFSSALETDGSFELRDCSKESSGDRSSSLCTPDGPIFSSHLEKSHCVLSLFNPFNETLFVEEAVVSREKNDENSEIRKRLSDLPSLSTLENEFVIEAEEDCSRHDGRSSQSQRGLLMRAGETWELPGQSRRDIVDFKICLKRGEVFRGLFQIRVTAPPLASKGVTLVYPFSSRVSRPSPVLSVPDTLDFGVLVGDQASSQPLVLQNSGEQLVQIEEIYEVPGDPKIKINYEKGKILLPNLETEVANVTYSGQNQPYEFSACRRSQKIVVRTNCTIGHLIEIPYRAMVLQCLNSPPAMAFVTGSSGTVGDLGSARTGGITDLLDYKLFLGFLVCGLIVGALTFFQVVVHDTELPTLSGDLGKGGCHRRSSSRVSPLIKKRDKLLKMWGWGALATVVDGIWTAFGSSIWTKDCNTPSPDYSLPRSVTPVQTPAPTATTSPPKPSTGGSGAPGAGSVQAGGRKGSTDRKNNGAAKSEQNRNSKGNGETVSGGSFPAVREPNHHPPSVKQPKASKFLRSENSSSRHTICVEDSVDSDGGAKESTVAVAPVPEVEPVKPIESAQSAEPITDSKPPDSEPKIINTQFGVPVAQKLPCAPPLEREKRKRRKRFGRHDVASNLGASGGMSPASSPASPVTPSRSSWLVSPPSPDKKSDQSTASLSPRSSGSLDLADAAPLPKLKVKVLNSLKVAHPAPATSGTESPRRSVAASTALQPRLQGKAAEHRRQSPLERGGGPGVGKKSNFTELGAIARKKTPSTGFTRGLEPGDGSHSYRASRHPHQRVVNSAFAGSEDGPGAPACFTTSASFPRFNPRPEGSWTNPSCDFGIHSFDTSVVPPPIIEPALRAPGAKITKQAEPSWSSLGITASPELHDRELGGSSASWHASTSLSGQSSGSWCMTSGATTSATSASAAPTPGPASRQGWRWRPTMSTASTACWCRCMSSMPRSRFQALLAMWATS